MKRKSKLFIVHPKRRSIIIVVLILVAIFVCSFLLFGEQSSNPSYALCTSTKYRSVQNGMNKKMITILMGEPDAKRIKQSSDQNFFFQGDNEAKIKEGWIYDQKDSATAAEVYFNSNGHVNGKNCGQG